MEEEHSHVNDLAFTPMKFEFGASTTDNPYFIDAITGQTSAVMDTDWFYNGYLADYWVPELQNQVLYSNLPAEPSNMVEDPSTYMASLQQVPQSYVGFLSETGASEIQNQMEWNYPVEAPSFMLDYPSSYEEGHKQILYQRQYDGAGQKDVQEEKLNEDANNLRFQSSQVTPATRYPSRSRSEASKQRARENERIRKSKVTKNLKALQDLVPHSVEDGKGRSMDHILDYIKYLQFQDLSRTSMGDESASTHFSSVQDHARYLLDDQMQHKPLEEMMGKLLEDDSPWAMQLMQSRGLSLMPISLAEKLS